MKVLVTGCGSLGAHVCELLLQKANNILIVDKNPNIQFLESITKSKIPIKTADVANLNQILKLFKNFRPDAVIHTASVIGNKANNDYQNTFLTNVIGTKNISEASRRYDVERIIFSSSISVYGSTKTNGTLKEVDMPLPKTVYGISKYHAEKILTEYSKRHGIDVRILRFAGIFGPSLFAGGAVMGKKIFDILFNLITRNKAKIDFSSLGENEFLYIKDAARATILTLYSDEVFRILNVGTGKVETVLNFVKTLKKIFPSSSITVSEKSNVKTRIPLDISNAQKILNYKPKFNLRSSLADYKNYIEMFYKQ